MKLTSHRPLPEALFDYARSDTHFLLYIYDCIRNDLVERSNGEHESIQAVLKRSKEKALKRYEYHFYDEDRGQDQGGWYRLLIKLPKQFTKEQYSVFRAIHKWRDEVARADDDSTVYVMPNHVLISIARSLPADKATLFRVAQQVSPTMRQRADDLLEVIAKAKVDPNAAEMLETLARLRREEYAKFRPSNEFQNQFQQQQQKQQHQHPSQFQTSSAQVSAAISSTIRTPSSNVWMSSKPIPDDDTTTTVKIPTPVAPRSSTSTFWGPSLLDRNAQQQQQEEEGQQQVNHPKPNSQNRQHQKTPLPITLAIPLPELTASIFIDPNDETQQQQQQQQQQTSKETVDPGARAEHAYIPASERQKIARSNGRRQSPEIFTIKSLGKKSSSNNNNNNNKNNKNNSGTSKGTKRKATESASASASTDEVEMTNGAANDDDDDDDDDDDEIFDYANAPSVMYPSSAAPTLSDSLPAGKGKGRDKEKDKRWDKNNSNSNSNSNSRTSAIPNFYARAADARTGLKRPGGQGKGKIGRSATFAG